MNKTAAKTASLALAFAMGSTVIGCAGTDQETLSICEVLEWNEEGEYSGTISTADEGIEFEDFKTSDFALKLEAEEGTVDAQDAEFTIEKVDENTITYTLKTEADPGIYYLVSQNPLTNNKEYVTVSLTISAPEIVWDMDVQGAYTGSDKVTAVLNLEQGTLVENLDAGMVTLETDADIQTSIVRNSDTQMTLTLENIPDDFSQEVLTVDIAADAVNSKFAYDTTAGITFAKPSVETDAENVTLDTENSTVTFSLLALPDGISGKEGGISTNDANFTIESQSWNEENNAYAVTVSSQNGMDEDVLKSLSLQAQMSTETDTFAYDFAPLAALAGSVQCAAEVGDDLEGYTITLTPVNGTFASGLAEADIETAYGKEVESLEFVSADENEIVYSASLKEGEEETVAALVEFSVPVKDLFDTHICTGAAAISNAEEDRAGMFDIAGFIKSMATSMAVSGTQNLLSDFCTKLGLTESSASLNDVAAQIANITGQLDSMNVSLGVLSEEVQKSNFLSNLNTLQALESKLWVYSATYMCKEPVAQYVQAQQSYAKGSITKDELDEKEKAFAAYLDSQKTDMTAYIADVNTLGTAILQGSEGATEGMVSQFFSVMQSTYNLQSQVTATEKSFLQRLEMVYLSNAAIAYSYAQADNSVVVAASLSKQITDVMNIFNTYTAKIEGYEAVVNKGNDILLASNQTVSKNMVSQSMKSSIVSSDLNADKSKMCDGAIEITWQTIQIMEKRATRLGRSIAQDLTNAGFTNVNANSGSQYVYVPKTITFTYDNSSAKYGSVSGKTTYRSDVYVQNGTSLSLDSNASLGTRSTIVSWVGVIESWDHKYDTLIAFRKPA